jgi:hypothetical protein
LFKLSNALLRLIAQHGQVELTGRPTIEPTVEPTVDAHRYTIQADCNQFDDIFIDIQSEPISIAAVTRIQAFIGHLIYAG